ncbi:hypothetical protein GWK47_033207 [Chionoecetes opilio]|uniref:Uncharacterized protein n=1 Tax=Chionoecetes opilio TaxID=41210 RepID=A0A8J5D0E2_CHIOP|nr:hypothetical protein GWK47_033207 [Chionoecetes opilio]
MKATERTGTDVSLKQPKVDPPPPVQPQQPKPRGRPGRKPGTKVKRDPNAPKKKPGPKPGFKRKPKVVPKTEVTQGTPTKVKTEVSDSDDDVALAVLAGQGTKVTKVKVENGADQSTKEAPRQPSGRKREVKMSQKMRQATLFDMRTPTKQGTPTTPRKSSPGRMPNPEAVMRSAVMKKMVHQYTTLRGLKGTGRKLVHTMDLVLKKLSLQQIEVIPDAELRVCILKRHERMMERRVMAKMTAEQREDYTKQKVGVRG